MKARREREVLGGRGGQRRRSYFEEFFALPERSSGGSGCVAAGANGLSKTKTRKTISSPPPRIPSRGRSPTATKDYLQESSGVCDPSEDQGVVNASNSSLQSLWDLADLDLRGRGDYSIRLLHLDISRNYITSLDGLSSLPNLQCLDASHNELRECTGLALNLELRVLRLRGNSLRRVEGLEALEKLESIDLADNLIKTWIGIRPLSLNVRLMEIWLAGNPLFDVAGPSGHLQATLRHLLPKAKLLDAKEARSQVKEVERAAVKTPSGGGNRSDRISGGRGASVSERRFRGKSAPLWRSGDRTPAPTSTTKLRAIHERRAATAHGEMKYRGRTTGRGKDGSRSCSERKFRSAQFVRSVGPSETRREGDNTKPLEVVGRRSERQRTVGVRHKGTLRGSESRDVKVGVSPSLAERRHTGRQRQQNSNGLKYESPGHMGAVRNRTGEEEKEKEEEDYFRVKASPSYSVIEACANDAASSRSNSSHRDEYDARELGRPVTQICLAGGLGDSGGDMEDLGEGRERVKGDNDSEAGGSTSLRLDSKVLTALEALIIERRKAHAALSRAILEITNLPRES